LKSAETTGILDRVGAFFEGVIWTFMAQWPLKMPKVRESLGPGVLQILDFRFRILDLKAVAAIAP
jgi:hypothetical protein